jgi:hypothetical protein
MHSAQPQHIDTTAAPVRPVWKTLRLAAREDEPEFVHLFHLWAAKVGIAEFDLARVHAMFHRAVTQDRAALVVAGKPVVGMVLLGYRHDWFSPTAQMAVLATIVDLDHKEARAAQELVAFSRQPVSGLEAAVRRLAGGA